MANKETVGILTEWFSWTFAAALIVDILSREYFKSPEFNCRWVCSVKSFTCKRLFIFSMIILMALQVQSFWECDPSNLVHLTHVKGDLCFCPCHMSKTTSCFTWVVIRETILFSSQQYDRNLLVLLECYLEVYSEPSRTSKAEFFVKRVSGWKPLSIFAKSSVSDVRLGFEYAWYLLIDWLDKFYLLHGRCSFKTWRS